MPIAEKRRAAIYARFSTDLQSDRSIDDQVQLCRDYCAREGLTVAKVYSDRAKTSASIIGRDGLLDMMNAARDEVFDVLVVEALDRISRDQEDLAGLYKRLEFAGIDILAVHDGRADPLKIGLHGIMGEMFLRGHKGKVRRGMSGVVRDGRSAGGRAYGYEPVPGQPGELKIVESEAEVVRRIFSEYLDGKKPREIAAALNTEGIPPPRGKRWNASTINGNGARGHGMLLNPLYNGQLVWNRVRMVRNPDTGRRISRPNPESEWKTADASDLRIIDAKTFEAVAAKKKASSHKHKEGGYTRKPSRVFSGLIKCGTCGGGMSIHDRRGDAVRIRCSTHRESGSCTNGAYYRLDVIEKEVLSELTDQLRHPEYLKEYVVAYREERRRLTAKGVNERDNLERAVTRTKTRLDRLVNLYADGVSDGPDAKARIKEAQEAFNVAQDALSAADAAVPVVELHPKAVANFAVIVDGLAQRLSHPDLNVTDDMEAVEQIRNLVAAVTIHPDTGNGVSVDITGHLSAILGERVEPLGGIGGSGGPLLSLPPIKIAR